MNARQADILLRRQSLLVRAASQRLELVRVVQPWKPTLHVFDTALSVGRLIRAHPIMAALAVGILAARRDNLKGLAAVALRLWEIYGMFLSKGARFRS